jgi:hypothetical protein
MISLWLAACAMAWAGAIFQRAMAAGRNHPLWLIVFLKIGNLV